MLQRTPRLLNMNHMSTSSVIVMSVASNNAGLHCLEGDDLQQNLACLVN